jgi:hypothetical protein
LGFTVHPEERLITGIGEREETICALLHQRSGKNFEWNED